MRDIQIIDAHDILDQPYYIIVVELSSLLFFLVLNMNFFKQFYFLFNQQIFDTFLVPFPWV